MKGYTDKRWLTTTTYINAPGKERSNCANPSYELNLSRNKDLLRGVEMKLRKW